MTNKLNDISLILRKNILDCIHKSGKGHIGGAYSCIDILTTLYFGEFANMNWDDPKRDRFIMSKGHAAIAQYAILNYVGLISEKEFMNMNNGGILGEHPDVNIPGIEFNTGSLGHGLGVGVGFALADRTRFNYVLLGDGECYEGSIWEAAFKSDASGYMFVSSVCIYPQASEHFEDNAWNGMPKQNDRIPGLAKRIGEIQGETYLKEYGWDAVKILRPSNVYGPFDDFNPSTAQVLPSLMSRVLGGENPLTVWGDGSAIRDFTYSKEVAYWMLEAMVKAPACTPINLGSGTGSSIKEAAETVCKVYDNSIDIIWDTTKPSGDPIRIMNMDRAKELLNFEQKYSLEQGIKETFEWIQQNPELAKLKGARI